jgi:CDP-6-deoxy-D-xylo-4-hexulose-3-dehydrase
MSTDDEELYLHLLLLRSHGLLRELPKDKQENRVITGVDRRFTFLCNGYNVRNTDVHAMLGIQQMKRLDNCVKVRNDNFRTFIEELNPNKYHVDFIKDGVSNFALPIISKKDNIKEIAFAYVRCVRKLVIFQSSHSFIICRVSVQIIVDTEPFHLLRLQCIHDY